MDEELYELLETEFLEYRIDGEVEDVLLELAEALADMNIVGKEIVYEETMGHVKLEVCGICEADEEEPEEVSVYIKTLKIAGKEFEIEDYLL